MIHYHGVPITPESCFEQLVSRHFLVSHAYPDQIEVVRDVCSSHVVDNGAFSAWKSGRPVTDWSQYYRWIEECAKFPSFDWAIIPDVIDGSEEQNDVLLKEWPHVYLGVPVWHMHESLERLKRLADEWPRIAIGSSGDFKDPGTRRWWQRMALAMETICIDGLPRTPFHMLRGLSLSVFPHLPAASADSVQVGLNIGLDVNFPGRYAPRDKGKRARAIADYIEQHQAALRWKGIPIQEGLLWEQTA